MYINTYPPAPCGHHGCEDPLLSYSHCPLSLSTSHMSAVSGQCQCLVYCTPPLMVPHQARNPRNSLNPEVVPNWLGAFRCTGVMRERQRPRNIGKRKPRASDSPTNRKRKLKWPMGCPAPPMGLMGHPGTCSGPPGAPRDLPWLSKRPAGAPSNPPWGFPKLFRATKQQSPASSHKLAVTSQRCSRF